MIEQQAALGDCMKASTSIVKTELKTSHEKEKLREHFKMRASSPPVEALPWSSLWTEYTEEMRELERILRDAGEVL